MDKKDDQKPIDERGEDPRVSGPLDRRLIGLDHQNFGIRPEGVSSDGGGHAVVGAISFNPKELDKARAVARAIVEELRNT
jgi:hypothetical protein